MQHPGKEGSLSSIVDSTAVHEVKIALGHWAVSQLCMEETANGHFEQAMSCCTFRMSKEGLSILRFSSEGPSQALSLSLSLSLSVKTFDNQKVKSCLAFFAGFENTKKMI